MGYYCTVPQCTSLAGKTKNVKFHRFPRDIQMADKWNLILKRGKPYTKYSKVCSLHFTQGDYNVTTMGQWKTLSKDAVPSQNLPKLNPDGSVMVIRKSRTVKYRDGKKEDSDKADKSWPPAMIGHSAHSLVPSTPDTTMTMEHDSMLAYRLQNLGSIANAISPQQPMGANPKPKKQDAIMQTDPVASEDGDTQPNNSYSEISDKSYSSEMEQYQNYPKVSSPYVKDSTPYPKDSSPYLKDSPAYLKDSPYPKDASPYPKDASPYPKDSYTRESTPYQKEAPYKEPYPREPTPYKDYNKDAYPKETYNKDDTYQKDSNQKDVYQKDAYQKDAYQKDAHQKDAFDSKSYEPKDYTKSSDYIPQTNEEYNKEAEKYALERKAHNGYDLKEYHKQVENNYQRINGLYTYNRDYYQNGYPDSVGVLKNQQHNLQILQEQHRLSENQNFFIENHIKQEIDISGDDDKYMYERSKEQLESNSLYADRRLHNPRFLDQIQEVKQEPDVINGCEAASQPQGSPYYPGAYYEPLARPGAELLIAKQNALAAQTQLWQNTMKRPFFYSESTHYNTPQLLHRYEDLTRILQ